MICLHIMHNYVHLIVNYNIAIFNIHWLELVKEIEVRLHNEMLQSSEKLCGNIHIKMER